MIRFFSIGFFLITLVLLAACGPQLNENDPKNNAGSDRLQTMIENPDIIGTITSITQAGDEAKQHGRLLTMMVENVGQDGIEDRALVTVTDRTQIVMRAGQPAAIADLEQGRKVEVKFKGPVAASHPAMATAGEIRIIE